MRDLVLITICTFRRGTHRYRSTLADFIRRVNGIADTHHDEDVILRLLAECEVDRLVTHHPDADGMTVLGFTRAGKAAAEAAEGRYLHAISLEQRRYEQETGMRVCGCPL